MSLSNILICGGMKEQFSPNRLRSFRTRAGLSIKALSYRSGVDFETISKVESGNRWPTLATQMVLAQALRVPLRALYAEARSE